MSKTAYRVRTQEAYDDLMRELEEKGYRWWYGAKPTERNVFGFYGSNTIILCTLKQVEYTTLSIFETFGGYPEYYHFEYEPRQEETKNEVGRGGGRIKKDKKWLKEALLELRTKGNPDNSQTETEKEIELGRAQQWAWNNCVDRAYELAEQLGEQLGETNDQIDKLAKFIMSEVEGEPSQSQGAVDTAIRIIKSYQNQETLSSDWIEEHSNGMSRSQYVWVDDLKELLVPKQEVLTDEQIARKVDQAYKDGYETGKQHATEKQSEETETVARVLVDYLIASAKLKLALSMEVEELEK